VKTIVTVIRGKDSLLKDLSLEILPRAGETLHIRDWHCKVLKVEHELSADPEVHSIKIFVR
jgi:hypothetical protein